MAAKRAGAVLLAVLLVVGAWAIRRVLDGDEISLTSDDTPVFCETSLADACTEVFGAERVSVEQPGDTLDRLMEDPTADVLWVTDPVWFDMLDGTRASAAAVTDRSEVLAHSPFRFVGPNSPCDPTNFLCLATADDTVEIGIDSMDTTTGLKSFGQIVAAEVGRPDFATNDRPDDSWFRSLSQRVEQTNGPVINQAFDRAQFDVSVTSDGVFLDVARDDTASWAADNGSGVALAIAAIGEARLPSVDDELADAAVERLLWVPGPLDPASEVSPGVLQYLRGRFGA